MVKPKNKPTICFDYDFLLYQSACVTENSQIRVTNKITSEENIFKSRTEFYGHWKNKSGGWLAEVNSKRLSPYLVEDFIIEDFAEIEPIENSIHVLNSSIKKLCNELDIKSYYGYTGRGDTFRNDLANLQEYKGNRLTLKKPTHLEALKDYVKSKHNAVIAEYYEADDFCAMDAWYSFKKFKNTGNLSDKLINIAIDKDAKGVTSFLFNPDKMFEPIEIQGLGYLTRENREVEGIGRSWFYYQLTLGDSSDNYSPACLSNFEVGPAAAYNILKDCKTDKEYWQALVNFYKKLYPEPVTFTNFRGDNLTVDWLYVLQEIADLAHMKRWEDDRLIVKDILDRLEVKYAD